MAILEHEVRAASGSRVNGFNRHVFTREQYYALADQLHDQRVELIEGDIVDMAPIGPYHASVTQPMSELLGKAFGPGFSTRNQAPITLTGGSKPSEPQPDVSVVRGSWRDYATHHPSPTDIVLIVQVADSSLAEDRTVKSVLYAAAGIPEYWIVNLVNNRLEVYREPSQNGYGSIKMYSVEDTVTPLLAPGANVVVAEFMP